MPDSKAAPHATASPNSALSKQQAAELLFQRDFAGSALRECVPSCSAFFRSR
jgi:hypothetical protein